MAVEWLAAKAKLALGVPDAEWERATTCEGADKPGKLLVTGGSEPDGVAYVLNKFLGEGDEQDTIFLYTAQDIEVEEREVEVEPAASPAAQAPAPATADGAGAGDGDGDGAASGNADDGKDGADGGNNVEGDAASPPAETPAEANTDAAAPAAAPTTRIERIETKVQRLHASFDAPDPSAVTAERTWFVMRNVGGPLKDEAALEDGVDYGVLQGHCLVNMHRLVADLYTPMMDADKFDGEGEGEGLPAAPLDELTSSLQRFGVHVQHAQQQVMGKNFLDVPDINITDPNAARDDEQLVALLEERVDDWYQTIEGVLEAENNKHPRSKGPLGEIEFWRERNAALSTLYEQINQPAVQKMLKVLELVEASLLPSFKHCFQELTKLYVEAKDNVKFLTTLERHFKNISSGTFSQVMDTIPPMMNAIRMVWIISRHYNTDERMVPMMERIAEEIADKVAKEIDTKTILRIPPDQALAAIERAREVLELWDQTYRKVREVIEQSGTDHRWEFDRKRLFDRTNYMARVCKDVAEIAETLDQFDKFLGPELADVTGDSDSIDAMRDQVVRLRETIETQPIDIFDRRYETTWGAVMVGFKEHVEDIEASTHRFINSAFQKLRSAEGAFDLLQKFQSIKSRDSINRQMMEKYRDTYTQYLSELEKFQEKFDQNKDSPPVYKNFPPVAGAIAWARSLYERAKQPVLKFKQREDVWQSDIGQRVKEQYLIFARAVDKYVNAHFERWTVHVAHTAAENLKKPILGPDMIEIPAPPGKKTEKGNPAPPTYEIPQPPFVVNFSRDLSVAIREAKYLDRMGFTLPEMALNVALQEEKYHSYVEQLGSMLRDYDDLLAQLSPVENELLSTQLLQLREELGQGFTPLNWNSQRIDIFINECNVAISKFHATRNQLVKSANTIDAVIAEIENTSVIQEQDFPEGEELGQISDLLDIVEANRQRRLDQLVNGYQSIGPLLIKLEELIAGTNTGNSPTMQPYYRYWERRMYNAVSKMVLRSMATYHALLKAPPGGLRARVSPLFSVKATMTGKDIGTTPPLSDVLKVLQRISSNVVESSKAFVRWKDGTCLETVPIVLNEDEEPHVYSFHSDVHSNPAVVDMMRNVFMSIEQTLEVVKRNLDGYRTYDTVYKLWHQKKQQAITKLEEVAPRCIFFDARLRSYLELEQTVRNRASTKDIDFIRLDVWPMATSIADKAKDWRQDYGAVLKKLANAQLMQLTDRMNQFQTDLDTDPTDLETLKFVLITIEKIGEANLEMELLMADMLERYRTLKMYNIPVDEEEQEQVDAIAARWHQLSCDSKTKDLRMVRVKEKFREVTKSDSIDFVGATKSALAEFYETGPGAAAGDLDDGVTRLEETHKILDALKEKGRGLTYAEQLFKLPVTPHPDLVKLEEEVADQDKVYGLYSEFKEFQQENSATLWSELDVKRLEEGIEELEKKARRFPKNLKGTSVFQGVDHHIAAFKESLPMIVSLKNDAMKERHWSNLMEVTGVTFDMNPATFSLQNLFDMNLHEFQEDIDELVQQAMQERKIEDEMVKIKDHWSTTEFELGKYTKNGKDRGYVLRAADEIKLELEDHMLNLQAMSASRFVAIFADDVRSWEKKLNVVSDCIDQWFTVQRKWMYLESIFIGAEDIRLQLPEEAKRFDKIDKIFKDTMTQTFKQPNVVEACNTDNRLELLRDLSERLDKVQKSLTDYLDTKRNAFPRFFFLSDDELLSVLGTSDPTAILEHLLKLFINTKKFRFGRGNSTIVEMFSKEGEHFLCRTPSLVKGPVETWLTAAEDEMHSTLHQIMKEGVFAYAKEDRAQWCVDVLGMVTVCGSTIWWTWEIEDVFVRVRKGNKHAMKNLEKKLTYQLTQLVELVRTDVTKQVRKKLNTMLVIDLHNRDIVAGFVRDSILNVKDFEWESQLRYYWDRKVDDCQMQQCTGVFSYGYEYMGLDPRLVITPLTDRAYMTITQALTFKLGTAPAGPAGTGKTESVKDLAKGMAIPCFVTNCGEGLDYKAMGKIFSGLIQVGAWGCFDEFNRINIEVLSVVSAQLRAVQNSLNYNKPTVDLQTGGGDVKIRRHPVTQFALCGFMITMNPGYAGRTELPDNLKALFRPVTMIVPDLQMICQIWLYSEGFEGALVLGKKMTVLYKLAKEQLSRQYHYDWGLRALKSVLVIAGALKRAYLELREDIVLMRALRDANMPKFVFEDVPLFRGLLNDLFPGLDCPRVSYPNLKKAAEDVLDADNYRCSDEKVWDWQVDKVIQMYETQEIRHTSMIVGPTGGGKSVVLETLRLAMPQAFGITITEMRLNPKAQTVNELYGVMDPLTRDWQDGMLSKIFRESNKPLAPSKEGKELHWITFDGDVDALWIESMNSVMDDNKLLTLPNGERIRLEDFCKLVIEVYDLQYASPATISRCGQVWIDPKDLGYRPYYERWLRIRRGGQTSEWEREALQELLDDTVESLVDYVMFGLIDGEPVGRPAKVVPMGDIDLVKQLTVMIDALWPHKKDSTPEERGDLEAIFVYALNWSFGAALLEDERERFTEQLKSACSSINTPSDPVFECFYDIEKHGWEQWKNHVPAYTEPEPFLFHKILVPTTDNVLYTSLVSNINSVERPVLCIGESGTAKTVTIQNFLDSLDSEKYYQLCINFSSRTNSMDVQTNIEANVDKRTGKIFGPPTGKKLVIFIDDMNMPKVDTYGTQQPIALLKFLVERESMYDRHKDLDLHTLKDLQYAAAMGPPGGGRNNVDPRFVALFSVLNMVQPAEAVLHKIYSQILEKHVSIHHGFTEATVAAGQKLTDAMLHVFHQVLEKLPPTPSKFHYIFNLRDLGRVWEGMCASVPDTIDSPLKLVRLWVNEMARIFEDRLISVDDHKLVDGLVKAQLQATFSDVAEAAAQQPVIFGNYRHCVGRLVEGAEDPKLYEDLGDYKFIRKICDEVLENYNVEHKPMNLVLFESALEHLTRLYRILSFPRGHALLVGVGGSGKQSLCRLAAYMASCDTFGITLSRGYGENEFRDDLKELYQKLVTTPTVFLFTDAHVKEDGFLEFINNMLTTGMVPALFDQEETDGIINSVRKEVKAAGIPETSANCWHYYVNKARDNMHIVLAMSPSGDALRTRCRNFPGLVSSCVIDWFFPWPTDALTKVADYFLAEESLPEEHHKNIEEHLVFVHQNVLDIRDRFQAALRRYYYVTPKNYLDFINNYRVQVKANQKKIDRQVKRLQGGLTKLIEAAEAVGRMEKDLAEKKVIVDAKTVEVEAMIENITAKTAVATESQEKASVKQKHVEEQNVIIAEEKEKAEEALSEALPAVEAAAAALENLDKADLTELKNFTNPPPLVKAVCLQCVYLKPGGHAQSEDWGGAKKMLGESNLLKFLKEYPKDSITEKQIRKVKSHFKDPKLTVDNMKSVSKAGYGLLVWVAAIVKYHEVAKNVEPLRIKVRKMEKDAAAAEKELGELNQLLSELQAELSELNSAFEEKNGELQGLKNEADMMARRLAAAAKLITGLSGERTRWEADIEKLNAGRSSIFGDCLISSAFLSYAGAFTFDYRKEMLFDLFLPDIQARKIPLTDPFSLVDLMASDAEVQQWNADGLPSDEHSVQNGIITVNSSRFPLCIDPQEQAVAWIHNKEAKNNLMVKSMNDADFMKHLELAVQFGNPFLFEAIDEELDPMIDPVLEKNFTIQGASKFVKMGDKMVEWDDGFRLFLTTKLANPHYSPEVMGKTMIINYSVTQDGLANQLLNNVVKHERPDLEEKYTALVQEMSANANILVQLEDTLLKELANSSGNILDNEELIATLDETKTKASDISEKLEQAEFTKEEITKARLVYVPTAVRASLLFFAMAGLSVLLDKSGQPLTVYETSLASYLKVFLGALDTAKKDVSLERRLGHMSAEMTMKVYEYTCMGIFEKHKLMFSFQLTTMIMEEQGTLDRPTLNFFLKGDTSIEEVAIPKPKTMDWLIDAGWKDLVCFSKLKEEFSGIPAAAEKECDAVRDWFMLEAPESAPYPCGWQESLDGLQKLCIMRCFRPDRVYNAVKFFVSEKMGDKYVQPPTLDYHKVFEQSSPTTPMIFIICPGSDPQGSIQKVGDELGFSGHKFKFLALGQGQGPKATQFLDTGYQRGYWILLLNCHLMLSWLKALEAKIETMTSPHEDFRLWMTTEPNPKFPLGIIQRSLKIVTEPPDGLKQNMRSSFAKIEQSMLDECPHKAFRPILYVLTWLHAVLLERCKYGKIGWNVDYDFNDSDYMISRRLVSMYLTKAVENKDEMIPWGSIRYLVGEAMYGGRVSDNWDRRGLVVYCEEFFGDFIFDDCQHFYLSQGSGFDYDVPGGVLPVEDYRAAVEKFPLVNSPSVYGLHPNAEIMYFLKSTKTMWSDLVDLQPRDTAGGEGASYEEHLGGVANDIKAKVPEVTDIDATRKLLGETITPEEVVLLQELERFNKLTKMMHDSLVDLGRALIGEIGMSDTLDALGTNLHGGQLPDMWRRFCPWTEKPIGSWMAHFVHRDQQYKTWIKEGSPAVMWLSGLHIPESYLTALVQTTCRMRAWPLDKSTLFTRVTKWTESSQVPAKLESGCYVNGLYLEGACWDLENSELMTQLPKKLVEELPIMQIIPIEAARLKLQNTLKTPVYSTQIRKNAMGFGLVFEADLATPKHISLWVLQGVALSLNTDQ